jgi:hypothetical protein
MFPPASPMGERIRAQSELQELEKRAMWNAQFQPTRRWRLPRWFSFRRLKTDKRPTAAIYPVKVQSEY